jgi:hypothetical protein
MNDIERPVIGNIRQDLSRHTLKVNVILIAEYVRGEERDRISFRTKNETITQATNFAEFYASVTQNILNKMETFEIRGSQWVLSRILKLELNINRYNPLRGRSYISLPPTLANKKAVINVKNKDDKCFLWSVLADLHPANDHSYRVAKYLQWEDEFDEALKGIGFPVKLSDVAKFAKRTQMSINVYCYDTRRIVPLEITKDEKEVHIDLLYLTEKNKSHYCLIQNLSRMLRSQVTKHEEKVYLCRMCLNKFDSEINLKDHKTYCGAHKPTRIEMPTYNNILEFEKYNNSLRVPFAIYADFECMLQKIQTCQPSDECSYTNTYQKHAPSGFVFYAKYSNGDFSPPVEYYGPDAAKIFYEKIKELGLHISEDYYTKVVPMQPMSEQEKLEFKIEKNCHICEKSLHVLPPLLEKKLLNEERAIKYYSDLGDEESVQQHTQKLKEIKENLLANKRKVADHDHLTGKFRGAAHNYCNLKYNNPNFIPIFSIT